MESLKKTEEEKPKSVGEKVDEVIGVVKDKAGQVQESVSGALKPAEESDTDIAKQKIGETQEKFGDAFGSLKESAASSAQVVYNKAVEAKDYLNEKASNVYDSATEAQNSLQEKAGVIHDASQNMATDIEKRAAEAKEKMADNKA